MTTDCSAQDFLHLREKTRPQALLSDDERIAIIQEGSWINLVAPKNVINRLEEMLRAPRVTKPPCLLLIGSPDSGKSSIFERFLKLNLPDQDPDSSTSRSPVVLIECPSGRDRGAIYVRILSALFAKFKPADKPEVLRGQVIRLFAELEVRMLLIDELHDALVPCKHSKCPRRPSGRSPSASSGWLSRSPVLCCRRLVSRSFAWQLLDDLVSERFLDFPLRSSGLVGTCQERFQRSFR